MISLDEDDLIVLLLQCLQYGSTGRVILYYIIDVIAFLGIHNKGDGPDNYTYSGSGCQAECGILMNTDAVTLHSFVEVIFEREVYSVLVSRCIGVKRLFCDLR